MFSKTQSCFLAFLIFSASVFAQTSKLDSLLGGLKYAKEDTVKVNLLNDLSFQYKQSNEYDSSMVRCREALALAEKLHFKNGMAVAFKTCALTHYYKGEYRPMLDYLFKALAIRIEQGNKKIIAGLYSNVGVAYWSLGDYPRAQDAYLSALKTYEKVQDKEGVARIQMNIGIMCWSQKNYKEALEYDEKSLKAHLELGDKKTVGNIYSNMANVYHSMNDLPKALELSSKALKIREEGGDSNDMSNSYTNMANLYGSMKQFDKADEYEQKALLIKHKLGDKNGEALVLLNMGQFALESNKVKEALTLMRRSLVLGQESGDLNLLESIYDGLSDAYAKAGNFEMALKNYKEFVKAKDSLSNEKNIQKMTEAQMNYDFDKKEAVVEAEHKSEIEKQNAITEEKGRKQQVVIWSVITGLLLVVLFAGFIFRSLRITSKQKEIIEAKNRETEMQKHTIQEKNKDITDSINYAKRIQKAMLPHRKDIWTAFPQSFVLFKPKDIVSGDFYFFHEDIRSSIIAVADCTGHGVPGAFMSLIASEKLKDAVQFSLNISEILSHLNKGIKASLKQSETDDSATRDGMDIALCSVDTNTRIVKYAGANRPIWIIRNGQIVVEEIKATKKAIGGFTEDSQRFDTHEIKFEKGDTFYISTDGFADTFGGQEAKKVTTKRFKEILVSIQDKTMKEQEHYLANFIENWKGGTEQIDDILVIGIRL